MEQTVKFDTELIKKYDIAGPRYTSYPTALQFMEGFDAEAYRRFTATSNSELIPKPLSLYLHLPFCKSRLRMFQSTVSHLFWKPLIGCDHPPSFFGASLSLHRR